MGGSAMASTGPSGQPGPMNSYYGVTAQPLMEAFNSRFGWSPNSYMRSYGPAFGLGNYGSRSGGSPYWSGQQYPQPFDLSSLAGGRGASGGGASNLSDYLYAMDPRFGQYYPDYQPQTYFGANGQSSAWPSLGGASSLKFGAGYGGYW